MCSLRIPGLIALPLEVISPLFQLADYLLLPALLAGRDFLAQFFIEKANFSSISFLAPIIVSIRRLNWSHGMAFCHRRNSC